jgi:hypothetical protein
MPRLNLHAGMARVHIGISATFGGARRYPDPPPLAALEARCFTAHRRLGSSRRARISAYTACGRMTNCAGTKIPSRFSTS